MVDRVAMEFFQNVLQAANRRDSDPVSGRTDDELYKHLVPSSPERPKQRQGHAAISAFVDCPAA